MLKKPRGNPNYDVLFKWAFRNGFSDIEEIKDLKGFYIDGKLVFGRSPYGRESILIYVADGDAHEVVEGFKDTTLLVYSNHNFIHSGNWSWNEYIVSYFQTIQNKIDVQIAEKEKEEQEQKDEASVKLQERLERFDILFADRTDPVITIIGDNPYVIEYGSGETYEEMGATAIDDVDGDISENISVSGIVHLDTLGEYLITYIVTDSSNNTDIKTRIVQVVDTETPSIEILGEELIIIEFGSEYIEEGAIATDNYDGNITENIIVTGEVDVNSVGSYIVTYTVLDSSNNVAKTTRTVNVIDRVAPVITLLGENPLELNIGDIYIESGATAFDDADGDLTDSILIAGEVDIDNPAEYIVTYSVEDNSGNKAIKERVVNVSVVLGA